MASERQFEFTAVWNEELGRSVMRDPEKYRRLPTTRFLTVKEQMGTAKHTIPIPSVGYETLNTSPPRNNAQKSKHTIPILTVKEQLGTAKHTIPIPSVGYETLNNIPKKEAEKEAETPNTSPPRNNAQKSKHTIPILTVKEQLGTAKHTIPIPSVGYETPKKEAEKEAETPNTSPPRNNAQKSSWEDWKASEQHRGSMRVGIGSVIKNHSKKGYATPKNTPSAQIEAETEAPTVIKNDTKSSYSNDLNSPLQLKEKRTWPSFVRPTTTPRKRLEYK